MADLEREAVAMVRQYGYFLPKSVKDFLRRLAAELGWIDLMGVLK